MIGFCEIHSHWLYGVDDGAQTLQEMHEMLDAAYWEGVKTLYATPHMAPGLRPWDSNNIEHRLTEAREYCHTMGYDIQLLSGAEILWTPMCEEWAMERKLPTLQNSKKILVEFIPDTAYREIAQAVDIMERCGYEPILAHVERYLDLRLGHAKKLHERYNVAFQVNVNTLFSNRFFMKHRVRRWLKEEIVDYIASDAHNCKNRPFQTKRAYAFLTRKYGQKLARRLMRGFFTTP